MTAIHDEYRTIAAGAGWIERADRGRVWLEGRDAAALLQGLVTNDVAALADGQGCHAAFLTAHGRMATDVVVYRRPEGWLLDLPIERAAPLAERLDQSIFTEDVRVADVTSAHAAFTIAGARASAGLAEAFGLSAPALDAVAELAQIETSSGFVARSGDASLPSFLLVVPADRRAAAIDRLRSTGMPEISGELIEALRIDAGRPRFGADMSEETIPLEAGLLDRAVSTTKGCYVGQEIVIRILHRGGGRVAKRLVKLELDPSTTELPSVGTALRIGTRITGALTSVAWSPRAPHAIALGYVHRDDAEPGGRVDVGDRGATAVIVGLAG